MRITTKMTIDLLQRNIVKAATRMSETQTKMSTSKRINVPSDDPGATSTALSLRTVIDANDQRLRNIDSASTWLKATEQNVQTLEDVVTKARTLAVNAANGTWGATQMKNFADQVDQYLQEAMQAGNESLGGDFLFSGYQIKTAPFTRNAGPPESITYNGDSGLMTRTIGNDATVTVNIPGDTIFSPVFDALIQLKENILASDQDAIRSQSIADFDQCLDTVATAHADIGTKINRLTDTQKRFNSIQVNLKSMLSKAEDLDYAQAITDLAGQQAVYRASLEAAAKLTQYSLLDYIS